MSTSSTLSKFWNDSATLRSRNEPASSRADRHAQAKRHRDDDNSDSSSAAASSESAGADRPGVAAVGFVERVEQRNKQQNDRLDEKQSKKRKKKKSKTAAEAAADSNSWAFQGEVARILAVSYLFW